MVDKWQSAAGKKVRRLCWRRDKAANAPCWLCGEPIDYSLKPSSGPYAYEPDHVLPRADHPELSLDMANIAAAHMVCNRSRGKRAGLGMLGNRSREW